MITCYKCKGDSEFEIAKGCCSMCRGKGVISEIRADYLLGLWWPTNYQKQHQRYGRQLSWLISNFPVQAERHGWTEKSKNRFFDILNDGFAAACKEFGLSLKSDNPGVVTIARQLRENPGVTITLSAEGVEITKSSC